MPDKLSRQELRERPGHFEDMLEAGGVQSGEMRLPSALPLATEKQAISRSTFAGSTVAGARAREPPGTGSTLVSEPERKGHPNA
jgi:hypothetical protein